VDIDEDSVTLGGMVDKALNKAISTKRKADCQQNKIETAQVVAWIAGARDLARDWHAFGEAEGARALSAFHDVRSAASAVHTSLEKVLRGISPSMDVTALEKGENAALATAYKASSLLVQQLHMTDIITNPESAAYGKTRGVPVFRAVERLVWVFREKAARRDIKLRLDGPSHNQPAVYESFDLVLLVLIDNAVKYSLNGQTVEISVTDQGTSACAVRIASYGPIVPEGERDRIFGRGMRGSNAPALSPSGMGIGLWVAQRVAGAHGFTIRYSAGRATGALNGLPIGVNTFTFTVHSE
jgi:signal transduction histidine kinase